MNSKLFICQVTAIIVYSKLHNRVTFSSLFSHSFKREKSMILLLLKLETSSELVLFVSLMILNRLYYVLVVIQKPARVPGYHFSHQWTSILEVFFYTFHFQKRLSIVWSVYESKYVFDLLLCIAQRVATQIYKSCYSTLFKDFLCWS